MALTSSYCHILYKRNRRCTLLFVAATAPFTPFYRALDWIVTDPLEAIKDEIEQRKGQYDVLIVMSHVGVFLMKNYVKKSRDRCDTRKPHTSSF